MKYEDLSYEEVIATVEKELSIDSDNLDTEVLRNVKIFTTLENIYAARFRKFKTLIRQKDAVEVQRWRRYTGKLPAQHYKDEPLSEAILKTDIDKYMNIDPIVVEIRGLVDTEEKVVKFLETAKGSIRQRGYDIKTALEFRRMMLGA